MARYRMEDNTILDTANAVDSWEEVRDFDGRNHISRATGSQWVHQKLYKSRRGRYYIVHTSQWQGSRPHAEWVSPQEAARWLIHQEHDIPDNLTTYVDEVTE